MGDYSENEDDPPVYESSGDEWDESMELEKKRNRRRTSQRLSKKPRITHIDTSDSEEEYIEKFVNGTNRKTKKTPTKVAITNKSPTTTVATTTTTTTAVTTITPEKPVTVVSFQHNFSTGSFVVNKKDAQQGSSTNPPCIWKIDGKALLQKFEPFEEDGKVRHRNTSVYTGWSSLDKDNYVSIHVQVYLHLGQKMIVEVDWDQLKTIVIDSD